MQRGYGSVGGRRRSGGAAAWQWIIIGGVFGFGCAAVFVLGALVLNVISIDSLTVANLPTQTPFVITATPPPATNTPEPEEEPPTATPGIVLEFQPPTATPTFDPTFVTLTPGAAPQATAQGGFDFGALGALSVPANPGASVAGTNATNQTLVERLRTVASDTVLVDSGEFLMGTTAAEVSQAVQECLGGYGGDPGRCLLEYGEDAVPEHRVTLDSFRIEISEVSYAQYLIFMNALGPGSHRNGCGGQPCMQTRTESETSNVQFDSVNYTVPSIINDFPMTNVTWYGARAYCEALGRRLPTEAEWERAARGRDNSVYPWGNTWNATLASTRRPADGGEPQKAPVFAFPAGASDWGAGNMAGNVAEWVSDWYDARYYTRPEASGLNPTGPAVGTEKVVRGGSWDTVPFFVRSVHRQSQDPLQPTASTGFRCVEDIGGSPSPGGSPLGATNPLQLPSDLTLPGASAGANEEAFGTAPTLPPAPGT